MGQAECCVARDRDDVAEERRASVALVRPMSDGITVFGTADIVEEQDAKKVVTLASLKAVENAVQRTKPESSDSNEEDAKRILQIAIVRGLQNVANSEEAPEAMPSGFCVNGPFPPPSTDEVIGDNDKPGVETPSSVDVSNLEQHHSDNQASKAYSKVEEASNFQEHKQTEDKRGGLCLEELFEAKLTWKVVGGADKGGIMVREGQDKKSKELDRLSHGACIEQLQLVNDRLQYKLLTGTGPASGWVSTKLNGKKLCVEQDQ
mmetsp:Transcript_73908/g.130569  ORF Transcript_73908/g.130569 Transcript_73908/m.130569 type:complete len:262 (+) Transcript_73908:52-837(+)